MYGATKAPVSNADAHAFFWQAASSASSSAAADSDASDASASASLVSRKRRLVAYAAVSVSAAAVCGVALSNRQQMALRAPAFELRAAALSPSDSARSKGTEATDAVLDLSLATSEYGMVDTTWYPWVYVAEPHREMLAEISSSTDGDKVYTWSLDEGSSSASTAALNQTAPGAASCTFACTAPGGSHTISVNESATRGGAVLRSASFEVHCKYVRREIRELVPRDRELYFDAVEQMHRLTLLEGITLYGKDFRNYETFTIKHLDSRTVTQCTPYHGGDVFLTAHAAFNLEFEQSLQAVHPILAAPYWDYTIDDSLFGREWYDRSLLMTTDFYGDSDASDASKRLRRRAQAATPTEGTDTLPADAPAAEASLGVGVGVGADEVEASPMPTADHELTGRWQGLPVANQGALGFDKWPEANAWGRLTESWNTDSAKVVSRAQTLCDYETKAKLPGCSALQGALLMNSTTSFRRHIEFELHAEIHPAIGGAWRCSMPGGESLSLTQLESDYPLAAGLVENLALNLNLFWRGMFNSSLNTAYPILCPRNGQCMDADPTSLDPELQAGTSPEDCICTCPRLDAKLANTTTTDEEYDVVYHALDESMFFILAAYKSQGTRISNYLEEDAASGRWYWLDNSGAPLDEDANKAVTILIGKLIFHPGHVAPFNGPLPGPNDPIFW